MPPTRDINEVDTRVNKNYSRTPACLGRVSCKSGTPIVTAIAEKISALKTETYFRERRAKGDLAAFDDWLAASPDVGPLEGDERKGY